MFFINEIVLGDLSFKEFFRFVKFYSVNILTGLLLYLIFLQLFLQMENIELVHYAHTDTYGIVPVQGYLERIKIAYLVFFYPILLPLANMFPFQWEGWYQLILIISLVLSILFIRKEMLNRRKEKQIQFYIMLLLFPGILNSNIILYGWRPVHSLHAYQQVLLFLLPVILIRSLSLRHVYSDSKIILNMIKWIKKAVICYLITIGLLYVYYDNYCYMLSEFRQQQAIRYFTTLTTRILSVDGYKKDYPLAFINELKKQSYADRNVKEYYNLLCTNPYDYTFINSYAASSHAFIRHWCGYDPKFLDAKEFEQNAVVQSMPSYPDQGSIRIINQVIVVKF